MKRVFKLLLVLLIILTLSSCTYLSHFVPIPDGSVELEVINEITYNLVPGSVYIRNEQQTGLGTIHASSGSGFVFHEDEDHYYIISNNHVTLKDKLGIQTLVVIDYLNNEYDAKLLASDENFDLSILEIDKIKASQNTTEVKLHVFKLGSINPEKLEIVFAISSPNGQRNALSAGRVVNYKDVVSEQTEFDFQVIAHNAKIEGGSSGSVLINSEYEVVAVNYAISLDIDKHSLAIPIEELIRFLNIYFYETE